MPQIVLSSMYSSKNNDDDKHYLQIYLEQYEYEEMKNERKKEKQTLQRKMVIPNNYDESDESEDWLSLSEKILNKMFSK